MFLVLVDISCYNYYCNCYLFQFDGVYNFRYPLSEIEQLVPTLDGMEVMVVAIVGERFLDDIIEGFAVSRAFNSSVRVAFMGGSPQVFKPSMPFTVYVSYFLCIFTFSTFYFLIFLFYPNYVFMNFLLDWFINLLSRDDIILFVK